MLVKRGVGVAIAILASLFALPEIVSGNPGGVITVKFVRFSNTRMLRYKIRNGRTRTSCCDRFSFFRCNACDPYFELCLNLRQGSSGCFKSFRTDTFRDRKAIRFSNNQVLKTRKHGFSRRPTHRNPLKFHFSRWERFFSLKVTIKDSDFPSRDDLMDVFMIRKSMLPSPGVGAAKLNTFSAQGKTSTLDISYAVQCNKDFYGPACTIMCQPRHDYLGHYGCDMATGSKRCLPGWFGSSCLVPCVPRDDNGHYTCHPVTGSKVCRSGWYGARCNVYCVKSTGSRCDENGNKHCLPNWYGASCTKYCVPYENFICNVIGNKECKPNWYGMRCDVFCLPTNDQSAGYRCSATGTKICLKNWYGINCAKFCIPVRNSICNKVTGEKECNTRWHGKKCNVYCRPQNDQNVGYICDQHGRRQCLPHWYGLSCSVSCLPIKGKYVCNNSTGSKECLPGWTGPNCNQKVCAPRNDHNAGYKCDRNGKMVCLFNWYPKERCNVHCQQPSSAYRCNKRTGQKICRPGWYPRMQCDVYCLPRDDVNASYGCNRKTGRKICHHGWHGPECDCFPTDDQTAGYTCNHITGARVCLPGWTGLMCDICTWCDI